MRGKPLVAEKVEDQCEAITVLTEWKRRTKVKDLRCRFFAKVAVGDKRLCYRHSLLESLAVLLANGNAALLPGPERPRYGPVSTVRVSDSAPTRTGEGE